MSFSERSGLELSGSMRCIPARSMAGNYHPGVPHHYYVSQANNCDNPVAGTATANFIGYAPICFPHRVGVKGLAVNVTGSHSGRFVRTALYTNGNNNDTFGMPDQLVVESAAVSVGTTGFKLSGFTNRMVEAGWYWVAFNTDSSTATFSRMVLTSMTPLIPWNSSAAWQSSIWYEAYSLAAYPQTANPSAQGRIALPIVGVRCE